MVEIENFFGRFQIQSLIIFSPENNEKVMMYTLTPDFTIPLQDSYTPPPPIHSPSPRITKRLRNQGDHITTHHDKLLFLYAIYLTIGIYRMENCLLFFNCPLHYHLLTSPILYISVHSSYIMSSHIEIFILASCTIIVAGFSFPIKQNLCFNVTPYRF